MVGLSYGEKASEPQTAIGQRLEGRVAQTTAAQSASESTGNFNDSLVADPYFAQDPQTQPFSPYESNEINEITPSHTVRVLVRRHRRHVPHAGVSMGGPRRVRSYIEGATEKFPAIFCRQRPPAFLSVNLQKWNPPKRENPSVYSLFYNASSTAPTSISTSTPGLLVLKSQSVRIPCPRQRVSVTEG